MRGVIRIGDATSHGGEVLTGADGSEVMGHAVARVGDRCECPVNGHDNVVITEGDAHFIVDGKAVAFDGHKTSCGASLISSVSTSARE